MYSKISNHRFATTALGATAAFAFSCALALPAQASPIFGPTNPVLASGGTGAASVGPHAKGTVLYDQSDGDDGIAIVSQNFESTYDPYDSQGADDFVVPDGVKWTLQEIDVPGQYFNGPGPAASVNVTIYKDGPIKGQANPWHCCPNECHRFKCGPRQPFWHNESARYYDPSGTGSLQIDLRGGSHGRVSSLPHLKPGTYWVSVQANMDIDPNGEWGWETSSVQHGAVADWQNPGDGFGTGCTTWDPMQQCVAAGEGPDDLFTLIGTAKAG